MPGSKGMKMNGDESRLNITNNLRIIPGDAWDVEIGVSYLFDSPVYWQLPAHFLGDKVSAEQLCVMCVNVKYGWYKFFKFQFLCD